MTSAHRPGQPSPPPPAPFVVGVARSGTTLLRLMLDSHPRLAIPAETGLLLELDGLRADRRPLHESLVDRFTRRANWADLATSREELMGALDGVEDIAEGVRAFYRLYARRRNKDRWGDKTPPYLAIMDRIHGLLPEARFVHLVRDGRDVVVSLRPLAFAPSRDVSVLARSWREEIRRGRELSRDVPYLEVRFEDLVRDPERELRRICEHVALDFDPAMLLYHERARERLSELASATAATHGFDRTKEERLAGHRFTWGAPRPERIGRWRAELTPSEVAAFEREAGDLLAELGYALASQPEAKGVPLERE